MPASTPLPLSPALQEQWASATEKNGIIGEAHLFIELLDDENDEIIGALLALSGVSRQEARLYTQSWLENEAQSSAKKQALAKSASQIVKIASLQARLDRSAQIETHHLFLACVSHQRGPHLGQVLRPLGLEVGKLRRHLSGLTAQKDAFAPDARNALEAAQAEMRASYCGRIAAAHLLLGLLRDETNGAVETLKATGCDVEDLQKRARTSVVNDGQPATPQKQFSPGAKRAIERATRHAKGGAISCEALLLALLPQSETLGEKWRARGRELDGVEGLWTAEQIAGLRGELEGAAIGINALDSHSKPDLPTRLSWLSGIFGFLGAMKWAGNLSTLPPTNSSNATFVFIVSGVVILVTSGIGACAMLLLGRSYVSKIAWTGFFLGWLLGMILGIALIQ